MNQTQAANISAEFYEFAHDVIFSLKLLIEQVQLLREDIKREKDD